MATISTIIIYDNDYGSYDNNDDEHQETSNP